MSSNISITVENLGKVYELYQAPKDRLKEIFAIPPKSYHTDFYALQKINFQVFKGETMGIIGTNGSGKSTLLKIITGVTTPTYGKVTVNGKVSALLELGAGFNPQYSGLENIYLNGMMMGYTRGEMSGKIDEILEFADIGSFVKQPVKTYSSGMFARLAFAVAINVKPEILIVDEALSVGDVFFQNKCFKKFEEMRSNGATVLFVSHDVATVKQMCTRVLWIEKGEQKMLGDSVEVCNAYSNSILDKRSEEFFKQEQTHMASKSYNEVIQFSETKQFLGQHPPLSYSPQSILNKDVLITACYIKDEDGKIVSVCDAGESYTCVIQFESKVDIPSCIAGFGLETGKGLWIMNCNTIINADREGHRICASTENCVELKFVMPRLMTGDYVLGAAISQGSKLDYNVITWLYNVMCLRISGSTENSALIDVDISANWYSIKEENP